MTTTQPLDLYTLTAADRCDVGQCGARAYIRVVINVEKADLLFCAHHGFERREALQAVCMDWIDESASIVAKLDVSA